MLVNPNFQKDNKKSVAQRIGQIFEDGYANTRRADGYIQKMTFAPSSIGPKYPGSCSRRWFLAFRGADWEETTDALSLAIMGAGTDAHTRLQKILVDEGVAVEIEKEITLEDPPIRGFADAIIKVDDEDYDIEIKTTRAGPFEKYQFAGKPNVAHVIQVLIYMHVTGLPGAVVYQNSNTRELLVFPIEMNQDLLDYTFGWMREVYKAYKEDKVPFPDLYAYGKRPGKECEACPVLKACMEEQRQDIKIGRFTPP